MNKILSIYRIGNSGIPFKTPKIKCYIQLGEFNYINIYPNIVYLYSGDNTYLSNIYNNNCSVQIRSDLVWSIGDYPTEVLEIERINTVDNNGILNITIKEDNKRLDEKYNIPLYVNYVEGGTVEYLEVTHVGDRDIISDVNGIPLTASGEELTILKG